MVASIPQILFTLNFFVNEILLVSFPTKYLNFATFFEGFIGYVYIMILFL
jgi:hypothetical protein